MTRKHILHFGAAVPILCAYGCIPLTVGSTAQPVPVGTTVSSMSMYVVPNSVDDSVAGRSFPRYGADPEVRFGLDERSDIGVRVPSLSGIVANYKRRLNGDSRAPGAATAIMVGGGFVNWGEHAHLEATLMASAEESDSFTPYGGIRAMQVIPINKGAVHDSPTLGAFLGTRIGTRAAGISPEIGIFYDQSALRIRKGRFLFVPAITVHGDFARFLLPW
ncbi:MAG TPA: hypothetical protein VFP77_04255 [Gemmatimonadaceae bacterium]|nr:hypothetical protein [Gemmatimonadaceae bacterium]